MRKGLLFLFPGLYLLLLTGCVSIPQEQLSDAIEKEELSGHTHFLAQRALKGRKPKSWESATVRDYLKNRFEAYGLVPWGQAEGYEQPFGFGTNVIGVLPGADPELADEIVILSAHYDHVGKTKKGVLLGACDNASGVAALLEIAERLALREKRPKRSVCFASFDCEERMLLGSFAFTCREDFEKAKIAAVVNVDLLGRDFIDILEDSLFVVGTETYPELRSQILRSGRETDVKVLPIGIDLVGPRGDHAVFETMEIPVLFFSCGLYKDYHKPTDTADRLNYARMKRSAQVIFGAVDVFANAERIEGPVKREYADREELQSLKYVLEKINSRHGELELEEEQGKKLRELAEETQRLLDEGKYSLRERQGFVKKGIEALLPVVARFDFTSAKGREGLLWMNEFYAGHSKVLVEGYRRMVRQALDNRPGLFGKVGFEYEVYDVPDEEISFVKKGDGEYELDIILTQVRFNYEIKGMVLKSGEFGFRVTWQSEHFLGSKGEVTDFCLLRWREKLKDESYGRAWQYVLRAVTEEVPGLTYDDWMRWRLEEQGFGDEEEWLSDLGKSDKPQLAAGIREEKTLAEEKVYRLIKDPNTPANMRKTLIRLFVKEIDREGLLALVDVLTDETEVVAKQPRYMEESYPFSDHSAFKELIKRKEEHQEKDAPRTFGEEAENRLKQLTKQDFGKDKRKWRRWIKANVK
ncbi:MAG: M28 family metallopeptidase [Planctomycetota bacterium]